MLGQPQMKLGLVVLAVFQIAAIFFMLNFYHKLVSNPDNYYKDILNEKAVKVPPAIKAIVPPTLE